MRITNVTTEWMVIKAYTDSEWDTCDFILVKFTGDYIRELKDRIVLAFDCPVPDLHILTFWDAPCGWFKFGEVCEELSVFFAYPENTFTFVDIEGVQQPEGFDIPEQRIDIQRMEVYTDCLARFIACGKNTDEEFYSAEFSIYDLKAL